MKTAKDRPTRAAADLMDAAAVEGERQSRSAKQQLDHWVRVGRAVSAQTSAARRRVEATLAGELAHIFDNSQIDGPDELVMFAGGVPLGPCRWPDWVPGPLTDRWPR